MSKRWIFILISLMVSGANAQQIMLRSGDLLFRGVSGKLSEAIDQVTQTGKETHFSHMGLVERKGRHIFVLHAAPEGGSCRIPLEEFLHPEGEAVEVVAYRLRKPWQRTVPAALKRAERMMGKPYNNHYYPVDTAYYCSDFVYRAFAPDSVFERKPMTFRDPQTGEFSPAWAEHYRRLGMAIPEGLPGCNPNGMASSDKLVRLGVVRE